jgi:hypothetical protein
MPRGKMFFSSEITMRKTKSTSTPSLTLNKPCLNPFANSRDFFCFFTEMKKIFLGRMIEPTLYRKYEKVDRRDYSSCVRPSHWIFGKFIFSIKLLWLDFCRLIFMVGRRTNPDHLSCDF